MYLDQHWASDVLAGDVIGAVIGSRLVHYAHSSPPGAGPRWLVQGSVAPAADGGLLLGLSLVPR
jgi:membrane-associated phospholipid phosphatase